MEDEIRTILNGQMCHILLKSKRHLKTMIEDLAKQIYSQLGPGYSERVYHNAMEVLLRSKGIPYESERIIPIPFEGHVIGNLRADIIINKETVLEFKTIKTLNESAEVQGHNYLRLTGLKTAYLINFPPFQNREVEVRRIASQ
ncbi:MAG: GxxExxY protein [Alteromonadaceae bacterium TMED7]|nr:MAG: GxxExxY protein [Alteromonadaceae bacterium TMED7]